MAKRGINKLDDIQIRRWIAKGEKVAKTDGGGLTFTLSQAGTASWVLRYMINGRARELTLGNYPDITLAAARKLAREKRAEIDQGQDPAITKAVNKANALSAWTVRELAADFLTIRMVAPKFSDVTIYYRKWDLDNVIVPRLGSLPVASVTSTMILDMLDKSKRSWTVQKRILTSAKKLLDHAIGKQIITINPCAAIDLTALIGARPPVKKRIMLPEEDLRKLLINIDDIGAENSLALKILLATCVRSIELARAKWEDIDFEKGTWRVPDTSVKTRTGFLVPLTPTVIEWFRQLQVLAGGSQWVLPARTAKRTNRLGDTHVGNTTLWAAIRRAFDRGDLDITKFTPHDTRSTAKGHMRNMGISREISEIALNHKLKGMEGIYDVREEIPERRRALELWAAFLIACETGRPWNVAPLKVA